MTLFEQVIREAGTAAEEVMGDARDAEGTYAIHLAAHAVIEETLTGHRTKTLNVMAPCPYCGKLPPGMAFPKTAGLSS
jgi:hypothetical protein